MQHQKSLRVLLVGDGCRDVFVYGSCNRLSPESPVPVLDHSRKLVKQGMVWNVRENLRSFGIEVYLLTNDCSKIVKTRYIDEKSNQHLLRVDQEVKLDPIDYEIPYDDGYDAIVISDYNKGFLPEYKIYEIVEKANCPVFIDSKKTKLPKKGCYIKINDSEYSKLVDLHENLIVTRGSKGAEYKGVLYPAQQVKVHDVVGAGDTFLSALVFGYLTKGTIEYGIEIANKASAIAVSNPGIYTLTKDDIDELCN